MPGVEIAGVHPDSPEVLERPLFRSHKTLPRRSNVISDAQVSHVVPSGQGDHPTNGAALTTAPALPPTPPSAVPVENTTSNALGMQKTGSSQSVNYSNGVVTPSKPSHPPTPETTPPRPTPSSYRPSISQFGSSRAESFRTACEMISDSENETPRRSPQSLIHSAIHKAHTQTSSRNESPSGFSDAKSRGEASVLGQSHETLKPDKFESFDGQWGGDHSDPSGIAPVQSRESLGHRAPDSDPATDMSQRSRGVDSQDSQELDVPRTRGSRLRDRVRDASDTMGSPSIEQFREEIGWPSAEDRSDLVEAVDSQRFSDVSTSSTVEALIIEPPRPAKRTLRHTEKKVSLRSASSPITKSERTSLTSNPNSQHRLVHKIARITEQDRRSIASEISISVNFNPGVSHHNSEVVPVIVIPERRSSLHSTSNSRNPSKTRSQPSSQRAPSQRRSRPGSLDLPRQKKQTMSDSIAVSTKGMDSSGQPMIPPRSSSLSAPTSRNNSRTASLTSESLRNHTLATDLKVRNGPVEQPLPEPINATLSSRDQRDMLDVPKTQTIVIGIEDMAYLRPPSLPFTPASIPSSSPGLIEINEARTVVFFPHNNESLLLVNPQGQPVPRVQAPEVDHQDKFGNLRTPDVLPLGDLTGVDSPLRNPRPPPKPPVGNGKEPNPRPTRRFGSARDWAVRPRSDSFDRFVRSLSVTSARNPKAKKDIDSRFHPFWRPRRFWSDSPEREKSAQDDTRRHDNPETKYVISNSLGLPQSRVVFDGPSSLSRRSPEMKRLFNSTTLRQNNGSRGTLVSNGMFSPEAFRSQASLHQRHFRSLAWWRLRIRFDTARNLRKRLKRVLQQREEKKREARRAKLKQSIGEAVLVGCSTQARDILNDPPPKFSSTRI